MTVSKTTPDVSKDAPADDKYAPRPLSVAENFVLTLKVLAVLGAIGLALWAVTLWTTTR